jgi:hypothetical protein
MKGKHSVPSRFFLIAIVSLLITSNVSAIPKDLKNPTLLACSTKAEGWESRLELKESGEGILTVDHDHKSVLCHLKVADFESAPNAEIPILRIEFFRDSCSPSSPVEDASFLKRIPFTISLQTPKPTLGKTRFLTTKDATSCQLEIFRQNDLEAKASSWGFGDPPPGKNKLHRPN